MPSNDFDLDDLFRDEFKPHLTVPKKVHPVVEAVNSIEAVIESVETEYKPVQTFEESMLESSAEMLYTKGNNFGQAIIDEDWDAEFGDLEDADKDMVESPVITEGIWAGFTSDEIAAEYGQTEEEEIQEEIEEVLTGEVVAHESPVAEDISELETDNELDSFVKELQRLKEESEAEEAHKAEVKAKLAEARRTLEALNAELRESEDKLREKHHAEMAVQKKVAEEAHIQAERQREEEIKKQRKHAMMQFHQHIEDLAPEWKNYAFDHQWEGASTLALHESGLLADEMGLGKTLSAIMYLDMVKAERVLVVTPNDTNSNFTMELAMWAKHRFVWSLAGADKMGRNTFLEYILEPRIAEGKDLTLSVNYEQLYTDEDYFQRLMDMEFDTIVIDEAHNFKNKSGALFGQLKRLARNAKRVLPMTGTFILNSPLDIWPALHLIDPEAFPTEAQFRDHYCEYDYYTSKWVFRPGGEKSMLIRLGGRIVKRNMEEAGIVLPKMNIHEIDLEFPMGAYEDQKNIMRQLADHSQIILDSDRKVSIVEQIALITRQRQCAVWPAGIVIKDPMTEEVLFSVGEDVQESIKMDWVEHKLQELRNGGKRIAVFSQFKTALAELERRLLADGFRVVRYDGDTDKETKAKVKRDFDRKHVEITNEWEWDIVLCNFKTGGVGLNFTHATEMIMLDENWNPGTNAQAYARIHRIGQVEEQNVWIPRLRGSIDGWMKALNDQKRDIIAGFNTEVDLQKEFNDFLSTVKERL